MRPSLQFRSAISAFCFAVFCSFIIAASPAFLLPAPACSLSPADAMAELAAWILSTRLLQGSVMVIPRTEKWLPKRWNHALPVRSPRLDDRRVSRAVLCFECGG